MKKLKILIFIFPIVCALSLIAVTSDSYNLEWVGVPIFWISFLLSILTPTIYFGSKYSFIRTMGVISFIWPIAALLFVLDQFYDHIFSYFLLYISPILLFWLYRFIKYGMSQMFKDG